MTLVPLLEFKFPGTSLPQMVQEFQFGGTSVIVERRLAACANIVPGMVSVHRREGKVERADEVVAIFKTPSSLADDVRQAVRDNHSCKLPAVVVIALESVDRDDFGWILEQTRPGQS